MDQNGAAAWLSLQSGNASGGVILPLGAQPFGSPYNGCAHMSGNSPAAYPLTITSDGEEEDGQAGAHGGSKPSRTSSLRHALQVRSCRDPWDIAPC